MKERTRDERQIIAPIIVNAFALSRRSIFGSKKNRCRTLRCLLFSETVAIHKTEKKAKLRAYHVKAFSSSREESSKIVDVTL